MTNEHEYECEDCGENFEIATGETANCPHIYDGEICGGKPFEWSDPLCGEGWMR